MNSLVSQPSRLHNKGEAHPLIDRGEDTSFNESYHAVHKEGNCFTSHITDFISKFHNVLSSLLHIIERIHSSFLYLENLQTVNFRLYQCFKKLNTFEIHGMFLSLLVIVVVVLF